MNEVCRVRDVFVTGVERGPLRVARSRVKRGYAL